MQPTAHTTTVQSYSLTGVASQRSLGAGAASSLLTERILSQVCIIYTASCLIVFSLLLSAASSSPHPVSIAF